MTHRRFALLLLWLIAPAVATPLLGAPRPAFEEIGRAGGIDFVHRSGPSLLHNPEAIGPGVAFLDFDGDGLVDLLFPNGGEVDLDGLVRRHHPDRLFRNLGGGRFQDVTARMGMEGAGIGNGAAVADFDNDGFADVHLTGYRESLLFRSNGDGTFSRAPLAGLKNREFAASSAWGDTDRDGHLDLYVGSYQDFDYRAATHPRVTANPAGDPVVSTLTPMVAPGNTNVLHHARGDGRFEMVTTRARAGNNERGSNRGMGVVLADLDDDGWQDIVVASDNGPLALLENRRRGTFENVSARKYVNDSRGNMGLAVGDPNGDGLSDLFVTHFEWEHNELYRSGARASAYQAVGQASGLSDRDWNNIGWGCAFLDYDADGRLDLVVANGHLWPAGLTPGQSLPARIAPAPQLVQLFHNVDGSAFQEVTADAFGPSPLRLAGRGLAIGDVDADGAPDVVIAVNNGPPAILRNVAPQAGRSVFVQLVGTASNRSGIGARVEAQRERLSITRSLLGGNGYMSTDAPELHLGLGPAAGAPERIAVRWPSGRSETFALPSGGGRLRAVEGTGTAR